MWVGNQITFTVLRVYTADVLMGSILLRWGLNTDSSLSSGSSSPTTYKWCEIPTDPRFESGDSFHTLTYTSMISHPPILDMVVRV